MRMTTNLSMIVAEIEIVYKTKVQAIDRPIITSAKQAYDLLLNNWNHNTIELIEEFKVLLLNNANRVMGLIPISIGGFTGTVADPRVIFGAALKAGCCNLIVAHNHPSQNVKPSRADEDMTNKLIAGGKYFDIKILDHIILTTTTYFSMAEEGII